MAIVKVKYTKSRAQIKAHLRYITHRPGRDDEKLSRTLFTSGYRTLGKQSVYDLIDHAPKGTTFFKIIISPDPKKEDSRRDLDLWRLTEKTLEHLRTRYGNVSESDMHFLATVHDDHTDIRHIHSIVFVRGRLAREEIKTLKQSAFAETRRQRQLLDIGRKFKERYQTYLHTSPLANKQLFTRSSVQMYGCPDCGRMQPLYRLRHGGYRCPKCGLTTSIYGGFMNREREQGMSISR